MAENLDMASPEPRRESERERNGGESQPEQGGVFIRYATINDIDEIKSRLDRHDDKLEVLIADGAEIKARQSGFESRMDRFESRMDRLEDKVDRLGDKLDKLTSYAFRILIAIIVGLIILLARDFFF